MYLPLKFNIRLPFRYFYLWTVKQGLCDVTLCIVIDMLLELDDIKTFLRCCSLLKEQLTKSRTWKKPPLTTTCWNYTDTTNKRLSAMLIQVQNIHLNISNSFHGFNNWYFVQPNQDFWTSKGKPNGNHGMPRKV